MAKHGRSETVKWVAVALLLFNLLVLEATWFRKREDGRQKDFVLKLAHANEACITQRADASRIAKSECPPVECTQADINEFKTQVRSLYPYCASILNSCSLPPYSRCPPRPLPSTTIPAWLHWIGIIRLHTPVHCTACETRNHLWQIEPWILLTPSPGKQGAGRAQGGKDSGRKRCNIS